MYDEGVGLQPTHVLCRKSICGGGHAHAVERGDSRDSLGATPQGQDVSCSVMCHGHAAHPASGLGLAGRGPLPGQKVAAIAGHPSGQLQHQSSRAGKGDRCKALAVSELVSSMCRNSQLCCVTVMGPPASSPFHSSMLSIHVPCSSAQPKLFNKARVSQANAVSAPRRAAAMPG